LAGSPLTKTANDKKVCEDLAGVTADAQAAVTVAAPVHREFLHPVSLLKCAYQNFDVEEKMVGSAMRKKRAGYVACIHFESTLCVGEVPGKTQ
jgi:hypothetical protein